MINRGNWKVSKKYLTYRKEVHQLAPLSVRFEEGCIRHTLEWASESSFREVTNIRPTLPAYIVDARLDKSGEPLSHAYIGKIIRASHRLFTWLSTHQKGYRSITPEFLDSLRPPRIAEKQNKFVAVTIDEIMAIAHAPANNIEERRIRAAAVFWFLSGIRIGAFVTLPINAVNLTDLSIKQWPKLGVKTKFNKHETTYFLGIPSLLEVVKKWDIEVRAVSAPNGLWFAPFSVKSGEIDKNPVHVGNNRHSRARKSLKAWMRKVGLSYRKPHSFRHGHAVYSIQQSNDISDLKAISMNLMHENLQVTDGVYGIFSSIDVRQRIIDFGKNVPKTKAKKDEIIGVLEDMLTKMRDYSD